MNSHSLSSEGPGRGLTFLLATAIGVTAANLYYAQPLAGLIGKSLGLPAEAAGLVVTLTQMGYGMGVLLVVPLGDILENRRLILTMMSLTIFGLLGLAFATQQVTYFASAFVTGLCASCVQVMVPYTASFAPEAKRGQVVGTLMSGLMIGIMLSRPIASVLTDLFSWHAVFVASALMMGALAFGLRAVLPTRAPKSGDLHYLKLLSSMVGLFLNTTALRRRAIYQAFLFGSFCLFWTASPLLLSGPEFHLSQTAIALFALVGVSGAVSAPLAGKLADRGWSWHATAAAMTLSAASFLIGHFFAVGTNLGLAALAVSAILLDAGITANLVLGQRTIFAMQPETRSRMNGLYVATIFVGGSLGSAIGAWAYAKGGWALTSYVGLAMPAVAFFYFLTERRSNA